MRRNLVTLADGQPYELHYSMNELIMLEEHTGKPFDLALSDLLGEASVSKMRGMRFMLWLGLQGQRPDITEEQVGALVPAMQLMDIMDVMMIAIGMAMPEPEKNAEGGGDAENG